MLRAARSMTLLQDHGNSSIVLLTAESKIDFDTYGRLVVSRVVLSFSCMVHGLCCTARGYMFLHSGGIILHLSLIIRQQSARFTLSTCVRLHAWAQPQHQSQPAQHQS